MAGPRRRRRSIRPSLRIFGLSLATLLLLAAGGGEDLPQNSLDPEGPIARDIDGLWQLTFWIAVVIFVLVQAALLYSIFRFRDKGEERRIRQLHGNTRLEVMWTIIPAVLLAFLAVPTVSTLFDIREAPEGDDVLEINVIGHQWWWEFHYPDQDFYTANELHIPEDRPVYLTMTSADVIHSFWVPKLNGKRDVVPGRFSNLTLIADDPTPEDTPIFGQCAEFCGLAHADMRVKVFVHDEAGFQEWAASQAEPAVIPTEGLAAEGWETFKLVCTACHPVAGADEANVRLAPDLTHYASRSTFGGASFRNDTEHLRAWLRNPSDLKPMAPERNDIAAGRILGMPNFGLDSRQIDGLVALLQGWE